MFVCPRCKGRLEHLRCADCGDEFESFGGLPYFLTPKGHVTRSHVGEIYDAIYTAHENVWEDQGRDADFRRYFADMASRVAPGALLEVGCGEGILLSAMRHEPRTGIDPSIQALTRARNRVAGEFAAAQAEHLPFGDCSFGAVTAVGVMEHFSDPDAATREIYRVLIPGGAYIALIHLDMGFRQRLLLKVKEYLLPVPRPVKFARWFAKKLRSPINQPMRRSYTVESARACMSRAGFGFEGVHSLESDPQAPLAGRHVVILIARKSVQVPA